MPRHRRSWVSAAIMSLVAIALGAAILVPLALSGGSHSSAIRTPAKLAANSATTRNDPPVYAYFYQWYNASSWRRAKEDYPLAGRYSSDDVTIMRSQVKQARAAGINGFLTSWKDTPGLDRRIQRLLRIAGQWHFDIGVVYEALDFERKPLPIATVLRDMTFLVDHWGAQLKSSYYGKPVIIWTGTDLFSRADIQRVRTALGSRALLLSAAKQTSGYERVADLVDGEAYYWSSANPASSFTSAKLDQMSAAVHAHKGIWIAPVTGGFDGSTLGHTRVVQRNGGGTLRRSLAEAYASRPDGVGVISWNEWSENTYIEPSQRYGNEELRALTNYLAAHHHTVSATRSHTWSGLRAAVVLSVASLLAGALVWYAHARSRRRRANLPSLNGHRPYPSRSASIRP